MGLSHRMNNECLYITFWTFHFVKSLPRSSLHTYFFAKDSPTNQKSSYLRFSHIFYCFIGAYCLCVFSILSQWGTWMNNMYSWTANFRCACTFYVGSFAILSLLYMYKSRMWKVVFHHYAYIACDLLHFSCVHSESRIDHSHILILSGLLPYAL